MRRSTKSKEILRLEQVISQVTGRLVKYNDKTANGLTSAIIDFVELVKLQQAERYHSGGVPFVDHITGEQKFAKPIVTTGTADIHCTIQGRSVKVEVKIGTDRQSKQQKEYQKAVERAGGIYFIAKDFCSFAWFYKKQFEK